MQSNLQAIRWTYVTQKIYNAFKLLDIIIIHLYSREDNTYIREKYTKQTQMHA